MRLHILLWKRTVQRTKVFPRIEVTCIAKMIIIIMVIVMIMGGRDVDDKRLHLQARALHARVDVEYTKIPSEMEVAPPHKRFSQFSALIKL